MFDTWRYWIRRLRMNIRKPFSSRLPPDAVRISLCDLSEEMTDAWLEAFAGVDGVEIVQGDILGLRCDALVSPANSFGDMDGGLDRAIDAFFGRRAQARVKEEIARHFYGELPVGMALVIEMNDRRFPHLICAPTVRVPGEVARTVNAYLAMRAVLVAVLRGRGPTRPLRSVAVPGLCTGVGGMEHRTAARQMRAAYDNILGGQWGQVFHSALAPFALEGWSFRRRQPE
jgi:O-acetyl-ADP-ribose deacetylase (regulator of RNase III)